MVSFQQAAGAWFEAKVRELNKGTMQALENAMEAGENITKHNIETRGTEKSGKRGRIETGEMLNSVESEVERRSDSEAIGKFGWINKKPEWVKYQEPGTKYIEPMWALSDAAEEVLVDYLRDMDETVGKA